MECKGHDELCWDICKWLMEKHPDLFKEYFMDLIKQSAEGKTEQ